MKKVSVEEEDEDEFETDVILHLIFRTILYTMEVIILIIKVI